MKVKMKAYEAKAMRRAEVYKSWELQCAAKDVYLEAYKQAIKDVKDYYNNPSWFASMDNVGQDLVEVEFKDGSHQLIDDISRKRSVESAPLSKEEEEQALRELNEKENKKETEKYCC